MKKILFILSIVLLLSIVNVSAFFPLTHKYEQNILLETYQGNSDFYQACIKHPDACYVGNVLTDLSVAWYYINGGENYIVTHSPIFAIKMLENAGTTGEQPKDIEMACAVGSGLHATQDFQSHNFMIPFAIKNSGLPNSVIHVFAEQHLDTIVVDQHPEVKTQLNLLSNDSWNKCIPLIKKTLRGFSEYDDEFSSGKLDNVIYTFVEEVQKSVIPDSTGYDISFQNKVSLFGKLDFLSLPVILLYLSSMLLFLLLTALLIFRKNKGIINYISIFIFGALFVFLVWFLISAFSGTAFTTFVSVIKPFSNLAPIGNAQSHIDASIQNGYDFFDEGEAWLIARQDPDASGFSTLHEADEGSYLIYVYIVAILGILALLIYFNFKRNKIKVRDTFNF